MSTATLISDMPLPPEPVTVNGVAIAPEDIAAEAQNHASDRPEKAWAAAAEALVIREALLQKARALGLVVRPVADGTGRTEAADDALIRQLLEMEVSVPEPDTKSSRRYFENNRARFRSPDLHEVSHILIQADRRDALTYSRAKKEAEALIDAVQDRPGQFERMATDRSDCPSASEGGRLGQISAGQTTPAFEAALQEMQPGEISSRPVETPYGFHIIRLDEKAAGSIPDFEIARPLVEEFLRDASWRRAVSQFISVVIGEARITGVALTGASTPFVQ